MKSIKPIKITKNNKDNKGLTRNFLGVTICSFL